TLTLKRDGEYQSSPRDSKKESKKDEESFRDSKKENDKEKILLKDSKPEEITNSPGNGNGITDNEQSRKARHIRMISNGTEENLKILLKKILDVNEDES